MQLKTNAQTGLPCAPDILLVCPCCSPTSLVTLNALHKTASIPCPLKPVYHSPTSITRSTVTCHPNRQLCLLPTCISRSLCFHLFPAEKHKIPESGVLSGFRLFGGSESGTSASSLKQPSLINQLCFFCLTAFMSRFWCLRDSVSQNPREQRTLNPVLLPLHIIPTKYQPQRHILRKTTNRQLCSQPLSLSRSLPSRANATAWPGTKGAPLGMLQDGISTSNSSARPGCSTSKLVNIYLLLFTSSATIISWWQVDNFSKTLLTATTFSITFVKPLSTPQPEWSFQNSK